MKKLDNGYLHDAVLNDDPEELGFYVYEIKDPEDLKGYGTTCGAEGNKAFSNDIIKDLKRQAIADPHFQMVVFACVELKEIMGMVTNVKWLENPISDNGGSLRHETCTVDGPNGPKDRQWVEFYESE